MDLKSEKIISDKLKFVCVLVPKVATRSLLTFFVRQPLEDYGAYEVKYKEFYEILDEKDHYFKFSFVRNPYSRLVSCYRDKIGRPGEKTCEDTVSRYPGSLYPGMPFNEFVEFLCCDEKG